MKKLLLIFAIFIAVFWIQSCEQQAVDPDTAVTSVTPERDLSPLKDIGAFTESEADAIKTILAKSLAKAVANPDIRAFLKQEAMKEFDGDFDILLTQSKIAR